MIETNLANLYSVPTKVSNQAVRGNLKRFPSNFIFRLAAEEKQAIQRLMQVTACSPRPIGFTANLSKLRNEQEL